MVGVRAPATETADDLAVRRGEAQWSLLPALRVEQADTLEARDRHRLAVRRPLRPDRAALRWLIGVRAAEEGGDPRPHLAFRSVEQVGDAQAVRAERQAPRRLRGPGLVADLDQSLAARRLDTEQRDRAVGDAAGEGDLLAGR